MVGATALLCFVDLGRFTRDIDLAVGLDLDDFFAFAAKLKERGWRQEPAREHRWRGPSGSIVDLMPAGPELRLTNRMVWPESEFTMSLAGFEHVFTRSSLFPFARGAHYRVAPPAVIALLKIVACIDDPLRRQKDVNDLKKLFSLYEAASDRIFSDDVLSAELEDIEYANAFLLGYDVGAITTENEVVIVQTFLGQQRIPQHDLVDLEPEDLEQRETLRYQAQLRVFHQGFDLARSR